MKKIMIISFLIIFLIIFSLIYEYEYNITGMNGKILVTLEKCVDGDTVWLKLDDKKIKYRLLGIDSPEINDNIGKVASDYTCNLLKNAKKIEIEYDSVGATKDKYNRELVWIFIDDELIQEKILEKGYAEVKYIYANYKYLNNLYSFESTAKEKRNGIWKDYKEIEKYNYYKVIFNYNKKSNSISIIENSVIKNITNPYKYGCKFIGWKNENYLFDLSSKINKDYELNAEFKC